MLAANLGVITGIIFLAIEIQQNNSLLRSDAINSSLQTRLTITEIEMQNPELAGVIVKNLAMEPLTEVEKRSISALYTNLIINMQRDFLLFSEGILDKEWIENNLFTMRRTFSQDATYDAMDVWQAQQGISFSIPFREFVENCLISETQCEIIQ